MLVSTALCATNLSDVAHAADATWNGTTSSNYNTSANWTASGPPDGIATFAATAGSTTPTITANSSVDAWSFTASGVGWVFSNQQTLTFTGTGISVGAGTATLNNQSSASNTAITNFTNNSSAGSASITNSSSVAGFNAFTVFKDNSSAGSATITANDDSFVVIRDLASGGSARFVTNAGGRVGSTAGQFNIELLSSGGTTAGSIEGSGDYVLGSKNLSVGSLNTSTEVSGVISGTSGSLTKTGSGTLTLSGTNTMTGGVRIDAGAVAVTNNSSLGTGVLSLNGGTLQAGATVTIGNDINADAVSTIDTQSNTLTLSGAFTGNLAFSKTGTGTLVLSGNNTSFNGGLNFNAGTLSVGHNNALGNGTLTVQGGSTLIVQNGITTANTASLKSNLTFNEGSSVSGTYSGTIGESGGSYGLTKTGAGTLTLTGANTFSGGVSLNAGTLVAGHNNAFGSGTLTALGGILDIQNGLTLANAANLQAGLTMNAGTGVASTYSGAIAESGGSFGLTKAGTGTLTLSGANTYTGGTTVNAGTLALSGSGTLGGSAGTVTVNGGALDLGTKSLSSGTLSMTGGTLTNGTLSSSAFNLQAGTVSAVLAGSGALTKTGSGTATLSGVNTYSGITNIQAGTLALSGSGTTSSQISLSASGSAFDISGRSSNLSVTDLTGVSGSTIALGANALALTNATSTIASAISGTGGGLTLSGGSLSLTGTNTYTGATTVNSGTLSFVGSTNLGTTGGIVMNGGTLHFAMSSVSAAVPTVQAPITLNGAATFRSDYDGGVEANISGAGGITKTGTGYLALGSLGNLTYTGATIVNAGRLSWNSALASTSFTVNAGGHLELGTTFGAGTSLTVNSGSNNALSGGVDIGGNSSLGNATVNINNGGKLQLQDTTTAATSTITIAGGGYMQVQDNASTGSANITSAGTISLLTNNTTGAATVTLNSGGLMSGTGSVGTTTVNAGGSITPGNQVLFDGTQTKFIGTITVNGNLTFANGSTYNAKVTTSTADKINVTGTATLSGTVQGSSYNTTRAGTYTILHATGGIVGTFSSVTGTFTGARNPHLTYDLNNVYLLLDPAAITLPVGISGNPANVGNGINNAINKGANPSSSFDPLFNLTGPALTSAMSQLFGEAHSGLTLASTNLTNSFLGFALNPFAGAQNNTGGALGYAREAGAGALSPQAAAAYAAVTPKDRRLDHGDRRWNIWAQGYGGYNKTNGEAAAGSHDTTARAYGVVTGFDYRAAVDFQFGFAIGAGGTNWGLAQGLGGGRSDTLQIGLYGTKQYGNSYVAGAFSYAWHDVTTDRTVTVSGTDRLKATFRAHNFGGRIESGNRFDMPGFGWTPYAALQVQNTRTPGYSESAVSGSSTFALSFDARSSVTTRTELGFWLDRLVPLSNGDAIALRGRAAWAYDKTTGQDLSTIFQTLPGSSFTVNGAAPATNLALLTSAAEYRLANGISLGLKLDTGLASNTKTYSGTGTLRYTW